ncbi:hypothetical protein D3C78_1740170 [compost metagenome]
MPGGKLAVAWPLGSTIERPFTSSQYPCGPSFSVDSSHSSAAPRWEIVHDSAQLPATTQLINGYSLASLCG